MLLGYGDHRHCIVSHQGETVTGDELGDTSAYPEPSEATLAAWRLSTSDHPTTSWSRTISHGNSALVFLCFPGHMEVRTSRKFATMIPA
jgi:hypothetical protein